MNEKVEGMNERIGRRVNKKIIREVRKRKNEKTNESVNEKVDMELPEENASLSELLRETFYKNFPENDREVRPTKKHKSSDQSSSDKYPARALSEKTNTQQTSAHEIYRSVAKKSLERYRDDIKLQLNKRNKRFVNAYSIGDLVHIKIPEIDRTHNDRKTLPCK
ncbi:4552_t:CDS:2, partial [Gigaspora rosea]